MHTCLRFFKNWNVTTTYSAQPYFYSSFKDFFFSFSEILVSTPYLVCTFSPMHIGRWRNVEKYIESKFMIVIFRLMVCVCHFSANSNLEFIQCAFKQRIDGQYKCSHKRLWTMIFICFSIFSFSLIAQAASAAAHKPTDYSSGWKGQLTCNKSVSYQMQ